MARDERPTMAFRTAKAWEAWLADHHAGSDGIWLEIAKQGGSVASVSHAEALEVALCYGWIDGQKAKLDDDRWLQCFTPRRRRSKWSWINREKAEQLIAGGRMQPAGLEEVERAKADGRWDAAYASQRSATVPDDLRRALEANPAAKAFFAELDGANRYAILYRLEDAKRPATRARRLETFVGMLSRGERIHESGKRSGPPG
jgi:uncharacterized protein YdeI (YjbR/CyaY-like superfamily)